MQAADVVVIGSGILGASVAYALVSRGIRNVLVIEKEEVANRHSSGRNASYYLPMYDTDTFSALAQASFSFLKSPPDDISEEPLLVPRGAVIAATETDRETLENEISAARDLSIAVARLAPRDLQEHVPIVRTDWITSAAYYPEAGPIDVHALSMGYMRAARQGGAQFLYNQQVVAFTRSADRIASVRTTSEEIACDTVVNAAGAWAGETGMLAAAVPISFVPRRRHIISVALAPEYAGRTWAFFRCPSLPLYLKPEAGRLLASRMDEEPDSPGDCMTDDLQVAAVADAVNEYTKLSIRRIENAWAGHRTFTSDDVPVIGRDPWVQGFIWAAGLGGAGVMASPEVGELVADAICGSDERAIARIVSPTRYR
jgi:D-arginine dehydrogenase